MDSNHGGCYRVLHVEVNGTGSGVGDGNRTTSGAVRRGWGGTGERVEPLRGGAVRERGGRAQIKYYHW